MRDLHLRIHLRVNDGVLTVRETYDLMRQVINIAAGDAIQVQTIVNVPPLSPKAVAALVSGQGGVGAVGGGGSVTQPYTKQQAMEEVGNSCDWEDARKASLKKWKQIMSGDEGSYSRGASCGYCYVADNRCHGCGLCPATHICDSLITGLSDPADIIQAIKDLEHPEEEA